MNETQHYDSESKQSILPTYRRHARQKLLQKLLNSGTEQSDLLTRLATDIEAALYIAYGQNNFDTASHDYQYHFRRLSYNIGTRNPALLSRIIKKELSPEQIVKLTPEDMLSQEEKEAQERLQMNEYDTHRLDHVPSEILAFEEQGNIQCPSCASKHVSYLRRNAISDEEESILEVSCNACGAINVIRT